MHGENPMKTHLLATIAAILGMTCAAVAGETPSAKGAKVYFVNLKDGATISSPVKIIFGLKGMSVAPAGSKTKNAGHHHLFVDRKALGKGPEKADELDFSIPADKNHLHFGKGQTEKTLKLSPGKQTLQLVLGDKDHIPHNPPVASKVITITIK
jgi:hypothetical protein